MKAKRIFLIILDSLGIGELPDANIYNDQGSNTLKSISNSKNFNIPNLEKLGIFNIDGNDYKPENKNPIGSFARLGEKSKGKDTTIGHWEISGIISNEALPTYPNGFPKEILDEFEKQTGKKVLCNLPYSGTKVIEDYGQQHIETGDLIIYTSADSVFQIAASEEIIPIEDLYKYCKIARKILTGKHGVGRVIARPFIGDEKNYKRTSNRHDFSLLPPKKTMLDYLKENNLSTIGVGKINDIFAGVGIQEDYGINKNNSDGMDKTIDILKTKKFTGLCFVNLVDFDMLYGHRNDIDGYAESLSVFDTELKIFMENMNEDDMLIITADHGCDPGTKSTDHSREYVPLMVYGKMIKENVDLKTRESFADIASTILENFEITEKVEGKSFLNKIIK